MEQLLVEVSGLRRIRKSIEIQRKSNKEYSDNRKNYLNQRMVAVRKDLNFSEQKLIDFKSSNSNIVSEYLKIEYEKLSECFVFINSGGVCSKTFYIPLNKFFLNILYKIDNILIKIFPRLFAMGRHLVLKKT